MKTRQVRTSYMKRISIDLTLGAKIYDAELSVPGHGVKV